MLGFFKKKSAPAPSVEPVVVAEVAPEPVLPREPAPLFVDLPSVGEMAAFLRSLTRERRSIAGILGNLARGLSSSRALEWASTLPRDLAPVVVEGVRVLPNTLSAFALLVDAELGNGPDMSPGAVATALEFFGQLPPSFDRGLVHEGLVETLRGLRERRTALDILEDLGRDSGSERVQAWVQELRPLVVSGHFRVNDEQLALEKVLEGAGHPINHHTLMAVCLFIDLEVGNLKHDQLAELAAAADTIDSSMYAMVATAGAFGLSLAGYAVDDMIDEPTAALTALTLASRGALLACFRKPGSSGRWWEPLATAEDCQEAARFGLEFTGLVLAHFDQLDDVTEEGLDYLLEGGRRVMGCFVDGDRWRWRPVESRAGFAGRVMAREREYRAGDTLTWSGGSLELTDLSASLVELDVGSLLGWTDSVTREFLGLRRLALALRHVARNPLPGRTSVRLNPHLIEPVLDFLLSPRGAGLLEPVVGAATREGLVRLIQRDQTVDFLLLRPLARALEQGLPLDWLGPLLMLNLCSNDQIQLGGAVKQFDGARLRQLVFQRTLDRLISDDSRSRLAAAQLLTVRELVTDTNTRLSLEYELGQLLEDPDPELVRPASQGLVRLALLDQLPLPSLVEVGSAPMPGQLSVESGLSDELVEKYSADLDAWVAELAEKDELAPLELAFTDAQGRVDAVKAAPLVTLLASVEEGCRADDTSEGRRYFMLATEEELVTVGLAFARSYSALADNLSRNLADLVLEMKPADVMLEHQLMLEEVNDKLADRLGGYPYFGGLGRTIHIHHFKPHDRWGVWWWEPQPPKPHLRRENTLLNQLVEMVRRVDASSVRLLRLVSAPGMALTGLDTYEPHVITQRRVDPRNLELLLVPQARFVPLTTWWEEALAGELQAADATAALLALYQGGEKGLAFAARRERVKPSAVRPRVRLERADLERAGPGLAAKFSLPETAVSAALRGV